MGEFYLCVQPNPVPTESFLTLERCTASSGGTARSSEDRLAYLACSKQAGPPDGVRRISQHHSHVEPLPTAGHPCENHWKPPCS